MSALESLIKLFKKGENSESDLEGRSVLSIRAVELSHKDGSKMEGRFETIQSQVNSTYLREIPVIALPSLKQDEKRTLTVPGTQMAPYRVRLDEFSCTCPNWTEERVRFQYPDIRRACKHIVGSIPLSSFIILGNPLVGMLLPIRPLPFRLGSFEVEGQSILACQCDGTEWLDIVAVKRGKTDKVSYGTFGFNFVLNRWSYGESPRSSKLIKKLVTDWANSAQTSWQDDLPALPLSALEAKRERLANSEAEAKLYEENKTNCYVCGLKLAFLTIAPESEVVCPRCSIPNVLTRSGNTNRPERLAIYRKYDGDLYSKENDGLMADVRKHCETELNELKGQMVEGRIDKGEYRRLCAVKRRERDIHLGELEVAKRAEIDKLLAQEKAIRKALDLE